MLGTALALLFAGDERVLPRLPEHRRDLHAVHALDRADDVPVLEAGDQQHRPDTLFYDVYLSNPLTIAVLLMQRGFWIPTAAAATVEATASQRRPDDVGLPDLPHHICLLGWVMLAVSCVILVLCQRRSRASRASSRSGSEMTESDRRSDHASKEFTMRYHRTIKQITIAAMRRQQDQRQLPGRQRRVASRSSRASRSG